jgi:hypothetical protein
MKTWARIVAVTAAAWTGITVADWTNARCDIYPRGEDKAGAMISCTFGQRQGVVTITRSDGITHNLIPVGDVPGNFRDQHGRTVYRQSGLGRAGQIFRFEGESVYVYWDTSTLNPVDESDNPTAPYSTDDYDATTLLRCGRLDAEYMGTCPAGILRMEGGKASIVITSPAGEQFTINFLTDYVNTTVGEVDARLEGDTWIVIVNGQERYEVPMAAIEGG